MKTFNLLGAAVIAGLAMGLGYNLYNGSNNPVNAAEHNHWKNSTPYPN